MERTLSNSANKKLQEGGSGESYRTLARDVKAPESLD